MNRQQRKNFIKSMRVKERLSIAITMPPKEKPIVKEYNIGRNDKCPCGKQLSRNVNSFLDKDGNKVDILGGIEWFTPKYKNCCMKSGKYENYKTNK